MMKKILILILFVSISVFGYWKCSEPQLVDYHCAYCEEINTKVSEQFCGLESDCNDWIYWVKQTTIPIGMTKWKCYIK